MDLNEVAVFLKVVQLGSFSKAGKQLAMPNSTVSSKVSSLEKRLGVTLIQRTTRKLNITPAGEAYYKRCLAGIEEINAAEMEIAAVQGEPQGLLRVTAPVELGSSVLPKIVAEYVKRYPKASVEVLLTARRVDLLSESVDLAIRGGELKDSSMIGKKVGEGFFALYASPKYCNGREMPKHPRELSQHFCVQFSQIGQGIWRLTNSKGTLNIPVPGRIIVNDLNMVKSLIVMGQGIALLPSGMCQADIKSGKLLRILPEWRSEATSLHFVYPAQRFVTPKLSAFIAVGTEVFKQDFAL